MPKEKKKVMVQRLRTPVPVGAESEGIGSPRPSSDYYSESVESLQSQSIRKKASNGKNSAEGKYPWWKFQKRGREEDKL